MTDAIVAPAGQTVIDGNRGDHRGYDSAPLHLLAADHRNASQIGLEGRFTDRNHADVLKTVADLESRSADRFQLVLNAVKEEANRTRECIMHQKTDDLRFDNLELRFAARVAK